MSDDKESDHGVISVVEPKTRVRVARPPLYRVLMHNDDYTTREFVVEVLRHVFHKSESDAVTIMLHVHQNGVGVAGVYTRDIAETKIRVVEQMAKEHEYPLQLSMEPEDPSEQE